MIKVTKKRFGIFLVLLVFFSLSVNAESNVGDDPAEIILELTVPDEYQKITAGEHLFVESQILLVRENENSILDIIIEYSILDKEGKIINKLTETKGGIVRIGTVKELDIPKTSLPGVYTIVVKASYQDHDVESSENFEVVEDVETIIGAYDLISVSPLVIYLIGLIFALFTIIILYQHLRFKKIEHLIVKARVKDLKRKGFI